MVSEKGDIGWDEKAELGNERSGEGGEKLDSKPVDDKSMVGMTKDDET